ncbi:Protein kinase [Mycena kentingensis (nom. inval.)]|nr:Protein kinase [Mycena kentingensis (nom. inval.)]
MRYIDSAEDPQSYRPGGLHPTHLGDSFSDGRYTVVHKLGYGLRSTVWLVRDAESSSYVALKILASERDPSGALTVLKHLEETYDGDEEGSRHVARMLDHFMYEGPNGRHLCIVSDVQGPQIMSETLSFFFDLSENDGWMDADFARRLSGQIALGAAYLHKRGIAHGDLHPGNVLYCFPRPWTSMEEIEHDLGTPRKANFKPTPEEKASPHLPRYLVPATSMLHKADVLGMCLKKPNIRICDFSESYMPGLPSPSPLATPYAFRPPQEMLGDAPHALDVWALAVLFHALFAFPLFLDEQNEALADMVSNFGPFPEPFWSKWEKRSKYFDAAGKALDSGWNTTLLKLELSIPPGSEEYGVFESLVRRMVQYDAQERISAEEIVEHRWIREFCRPYMAEDAEYEIGYSEADSD